MFLWVSSCSPIHEEGASEPRLKGSDVFACQPATAPFADSMRRLSKRELENSVRALLQPLGPIQALQVMTELRDSWALIPNDSSQNRYAGFDRRVFPQHIEGQYFLFIKLAELLAKPVYLGKVAPACATDSQSQNCRDDLLKDFAKKVYRRPLSDAELTGAADDLANGGVKVLLAKLFLSPHFLYHLASGEGEPDGTGRVALNAYELADKLAYTYWQRPPDEMLLRAAETGELDAPAGISQVIDRMFADPYRGYIYETLMHFYGQWLQLEKRPSFDVKNNLALAALAAGTHLGQPGYEHREDMIQELRDLFAYFVWQKPGGMSELLTSRAAFVKTPALAEIYNVPIGADSLGPERSGLLTRAGMLITGSEVTSPVHQGVFIRRHLLCDGLANPPADLANQIKPPPFDPTMTTRESVDQNTASPACSGCHSQINPLGFAFENFDALGRFRHDQFERIFDHRGQMVGQLPIDTHVQVAIDYQKDDMQVADGVELSKAIAQSGKADACFVRNYFRFAHNRSEVDAHDSCTMAAMLDSLSQDGFLQMFKQLGKSEHFRYRQVGE